MTAPGAPTFARQLGCATSYTAVVWYWDRRTSQLQIYTQLTGLFEVHWERVIDDYSEARIRFRPSQGDDCCGKLRMIRNHVTGQVIQTGLWVWAHELALYRDGELVWQGPIFSIDELVLPDSSTDHIQITARDFIGWLDRRVIHNNLMFKTERDLSQLAAAVVRDAFAPDPVGVTPHIRVINSGRKSTMKVRYWEAKAGEKLRDIARGGLDFTSVGRAILIKGPSRDETKPTIVLQAKDFASGVEIRMVGAEAATVGYAIGGVPQSKNPNKPIEDIPPVKRRWPKTGGTHPFFGLIENWTQSEGVTSASFLDWVARMKVVDGNPPPRTLSIPAGTGLVPDAPVSIHDLVPSTFFTISIQGTCFALSQYMRLSQVTVTWTADQPESVGVAFIPAGVLDDSAGEGEL